MIQRAELCMYMYMRYIHLLFVIVVFSRGEASKISVRPCVPPSVRRPAVDSFRRCPSARLSMHPSLHSSIHLCVHRSVPLSVHHPPFKQLRRTALLILMFDVVILCNVVPDGAVDRQHRQTV